MLPDHSEAAISNLRKNLVDSAVRHVCPGWAEDVAHETILKLLKQKALIDNPSAYGRIAIRHVSVDHARKRFRELPFTTPIDNEDACGKTSTAQMELALEVNDAIASLSRRQKRIIRLLMDGCTLPEVADALGLSLGTVKTSRTQAHERLRQLLS